MATDVIKEYLVKLGVDISASQIKKFENTLNWFDKSVVSFLKTINSTLVFTAKSYFKITKLITGFATSVAQSDMDMQRWAKTMYLSTESAKALDRTLSAMDLDVEDLRDVALNPELLNQYRELIQLSTDLQSTFDSSEAFRGIRQFTYEFQKMKVILEYIKDNIVRYIWQVIGSRGFIKNVRDTTQWLMTNFQKISKIIGTSLGYILSNLLYVGRLVGSIIDSIISMFNKLPHSIQLIAGVISSVAAMLMAGPLGKLMLILQVIGALMEDYLRYKSGKSSSKWLKSTWGEVDVAMGNKNPDEIDHSWTNPAGFWFNLEDSIERGISRVLGGLSQEEEDALIERQMEEYHRRMQSSKTVANNTINITVNGAGDPIRAKDLTIAAIRNTTSGVVA